METLKRHLATAAVAFVCSLLAVAAYDLLTRPLRRAGYVNLGELHDKFIYAQQSRAALLKLQQRHKGLIDSLSVALQGLEQRTKNLSAEAARGAYAQERAKFYRFQDDLSQNQRRQEEEEEAKVWKRLNEYVQDFGRERGFDLVLGANGTGSIMYVDASLDLTQDAVAYVNKRFKGERGD